MARVTVLGGVLILALLAAGLTEATLALGPHGSLTNDISLRPATPKPTATPTPSPTPVPTLVPTIAPVPTVAVPTAVTTMFVHMRAGKSIYTPILIDINAGTVVQLLSDSDAQWQQVRYNGFTGYLFKATAFAR